MIRTSASDDGDRTGTPLASPEGVRSQIDGDAVAPLLVAHHWSLPAVMSWALHGVPETLDRFTADHERN
jgi:hypothetical protein